MQLSNQFEKQRQAFLDAVANGASEIDMVINITDVKNKRFDLVEEEIRQIHEACQGRILKVIVEICFSRIKYNTYAISTSKYSAIPSIV